MKIKQKLFAAAFAVSALASAQEAPTFSLSGEFRPRSEYFGNGGNFTGGSFPAQTAVDSDEGFVRTTVRAALNADYTTETYKLHIGVQEVFAFGDRPQIATNGNGNFRVQEAWADVKLTENSTLKIGRQPLSYDDQRILGGLGWAQQARTHDAVVLKYKKDGYSLDIGGALNTTTDEVFDTSALFSYRDMGFVRANKKYNDLNISALALLNTFQDANTAAGSAKSTLVTAGLHADYKTGIVGLAANAYIQDGQRLGGLDVEGAYLASLNATIKAADNFTVLAGGEIISGQDEDSAAFFPLYGTNHKFNGYMDRFFVGNHANGEGLIDLNLGFETKVKGYGVTLKAHKFNGESDLASGAGRDDLGTELDLVVARKFKGYKLVGGYSQFFEGDNEPANAKSTQNWAWLMLIIKPKFL